MDFDVYRNYVMVAESYTISEAAKRLNIAQPALSTQIKNLEAYYGVTLIKTKQGSRHIELTDAGELLYQRMKHLLTEADLLRKDVKTSASHEKETINVGIIPSLSSGVSRYLKLFEEAHPDVHWNVIVHDVKYLADQLSRGNIHCMLTSSPPSQAYLYSCEGETENTIYAIGSKENLFLKDKSYIKLCSLVSQSVAITLDLEEPFALACREDNLDIPLLLKSSSVMTIIDMVMNSDLIAIVAGPLPQWVQERITMVPVRSKYLKETEVLYTYKGYKLPEIATKFVDFLKMAMG